MRHIVLAPLGFRARVWDTSRTVTPWSEAMTKKPRWRKLWRAHDGGTGGTQVQKRRGKGTKDTRSRRRANGSPRQIGEGREVTITGRAGGDSSLSVDSVTEISRHSQEGSISGVSVQGKLSLWQRSNSTFTCGQEQSKGWSPAPNYRNRAFGHGTAPAGGEGKHTRGAGAPNPAATPTGMRQDSFRERR